MRGIGIDMVTISEVGRLMDELGDVYLTHTFSERERSDLANVLRKAEFLAGRFAVKEAVFKSLAHLLPDKTFDLRIVETINAIDGHPLVLKNEKMLKIMEQANVSELHISISNEGDLAVAIAVAV